MSSAPSSAELLHVGGERTTGENIRVQNGKAGIKIPNESISGNFFLLFLPVTAVTAIANIVKSSLGPVGLDKMLVDDIGVSFSLLLFFKKQRLFVSVGSFFLTLTRKLRWLYGLFCTVKNAHDCDNCVQVLSFVNILSQETRYEDPTNLVYFSPVAAVCSSFVFLSCVLKVEEWFITKGCKFKLMDNKWA